MLKEILRVLKGVYKGLGFRVLRALKGVYRAVKGDFKGSKKVLQGFRV